MAKVTAEDVLRESERRARKTKEYMSSEEYRSKMVERLKINDAGNRSLKARGIIYNLCRRDDNPAEGCIFFIENFGWTFNPKEQDVKHMPFILFEFQKRAIRSVVEHIETGRDLLIEKTREMGVSWVVFAYISLWYWLFRDGANILLGSYKKDLVDNKTIDSLFGKIDYGMQGLPKWMFPEGFKMDKHRTQLKLFNPQNGNLITGDTMNPNFGRGSRKNVIMFDELAFWEYAQDAWESAGDSTNCRIANSTPNGYDYYAMLRESGIDVLTLHWREHPLKDDEWYRYECLRRTPEEIAQELDISYNKSKVGRVYPEWTEPNVTIGRYEYDDNLPLYVGWDFGKTDDTAIIWAQPHHDGLKIIDTYRKSGKNIDFFIPFVTGIIGGENKNAYTPDEIEIISEHRNWKKATHFGDPAGRFQNQVTDQTVLDVLKNYGIHVNFKDAWKVFSLRKSAVKRLLMDKIFINDNPRTRYFNVCMINAAYPQVKNSGVQEVRSEKPKHDNTSHYRSAMEYMALGLEDKSNMVFKPHDKFKRIIGPGQSRVWGRRAVGY